MKHLRRNYRGVIARNSDALKRLAIGLSEATSRVEQSFWEQQLIELIDKAFTPAGQEALQATLDRLWEQHPAAYETLADLIEARTESKALIHQGIRYQCLFFCAPLLAWSRLRIPTPMLSADALEGIRAHLYAHIFSRNVKLALADRLLSPDQLPFGFNATHKWARELFNCAVENQPLHLRSQNLPETAEFISDLRFMIGAVLVPEGEPLFRWQEDNCQQEDAFAAWSTQAHALFAQHLPGCTVQLLLPGAFYNTCRQADREARSFFILAGIAYLCTLLECTPDQIMASVAPFYAQESHQPTQEAPPEPARDTPHRNKAADPIVEYRIGLQHKDAETIQHGVVWPIFSEEEVPTAADEIREILQAAGLKEIVMHTHPFPLEYCDDCGAPLFPNEEGETVHTEAPEEPENTPHYLH